MKIAVACHKPYWMSDDPVYLYLSVGDALRPAPIPGTVPDSTGENISLKNASFCELTGLYWIWKNLDEDILGLCHYRRYFAQSRFGDRKARILTGARARALMADTPVLLPKKRHYWIETNYSQYAHAHHAIDLDKTREILAQAYPDYLPAFDAVMGRTSGHRFNMLLMRADVLDAYCTWLFDVLFRLEGCLDISGYSPSDRRVFGYISERLLDVWLETNGVSYRELPVVNLENQHWLKKGTAFVLRKLRGGKKNEKAKEPGECPRT